MYARRYPNARDANPGTRGGKPERITPGEPERGSRLPRGDVGESPDCPLRTPGMRRSSVWGPSAEHNNLWVRVPNEGMSSAQEVQ